MRVIKVTKGTPEVVDLSPDALGTVQQHVGGYVELCRTRDPDVVVYANEDGAIQQLPPTPNLLGGPPVFWYGDYIVCKRSTNSEDLFGDFTPEEAEALMTKLGHPAPKVRRRPQRNGRDPKQGKGSSR